MSDSRRFSIIVNPVAGRGKSRGIDSYLGVLLKNRSVDFSIQRTHHASEAEHLAREAAKVADVVVAVGGDGTSNEVANGLVGTDASMAVIPSGSGNDFGKLLGMSGDVRTSIDRILHGRPKKIDTGTLRVTDAGSKEQSRIFVNSIGIGFDAIVAYESQRIRHLNGLALYLVAVVRSLRRLKSHTFNVTANGENHVDDYLLLCVGNGSREGGGFRVTPDGDPMDGEFQVCTIRQVSILRALRILPTAISGRHGKFREVEFFGTKRIKIASERPFAVHCDGEVLGIENQVAEIEIKPASLNVIAAEGALG